MSIKRLTVAAFDKNSIKRLCDYADKLNNKQLKTLLEGLQGVGQWFSGAFMASTSDDFNIRVTSAVPDSRHGFVADTELTANALKWLALNLGLLDSPPKVLYRMHDMIGDADFCKFAIEWGKKKDDLNKKNKWSTEIHTEEKVAEFFKALHDLPTRSARNSWEDLRDRRLRYGIYHIENAFGEYIRTQRTIGSSMEFTTQKPVLSWTSAVSSIRSFGKGNGRPKKLFDVFIAVKTSDVDPIFTNEDLSVSVAVSMRDYITRRYALTKADGKGTLLQQTMERLASSLATAASYSKQKEWVVHHPGKKVKAYLYSVPKFTKDIMNKKVLSGYDDVPVLQHNFNDNLRSGTGNAPDMNSGDPEGWDEGQERYEIEFEGNQSFTDKELEESLTFPNTDYTGDHPPSDINTGPDELRKITDFKSSAPSSSFSSVMRLRNLGTHAK